MATLNMIEEALRTGRGEPATRAAVELLHGADPSDARVRQVAEVLARQYADFVVRPVMDVLEKAEAVLGKPVADALRAPIRSDIELTAEWSSRLRNLANERLANMLLDTVKANDMTAAEQAAAALLGSGTGSEDSARRARQVGSLLGGLIHEKARAEALIRQISRSHGKYGLDAVTATDMEEEFTRSQAAAVRRERPVGAVSRVELTQNAVEISRALPGRMAIHEPNEEDVAKFYAVLSAVWRAALGSPGAELLHEATALLVEFSPKELAAAGALAGIEQRLHSTLGRTARGVAAQCFRKAGASHNLYPPYEAFTRRVVATRAGRQAVEVLGLLANPDAVPVLVEWMKDPKSPVRQEVIYALGTIGGPKALHTLLAALKQDVAGKVVDGDRRRDALVLLSSLGRSARSQSSAERSRLIADVVRIVPRDDSEFVLRILLNYFLGKLDGFDPAIMDWAAKTAVDALWKLENPELARRAGQSPLGYRQPLVDLLVRLAPQATRTICDSISDHLTQFVAGAYLASAEFLAKETPARDAGIPLLRQMLFNTLLHDDTEPKSAYARETVRDAATETESEITNDRIMGAIIYAATQSDTDEALAFLSEMFQQVQAGQIPRPGGETAQLLMDAHMKASKKAGKSAFAPPPGAGPAPEAPTAVTDEDMKYLDDLQAHYLLPGKRRQKKVAAMQALATRKISAAVGPVIAHLSDRDDIISAAATTAVLDFVKPPVHAETLGKALDELLGTLAGCDSPTRVRIAGLLRKMGPGKPPLKDKLERLAASSVGNEAKAVIATLLGTSALGAGQPKAPGAGATAESPAADAEPLDPSVEKFLPSKGAGPAQMSALDKKRAYMLARQEWIRSGKKGPEPKPPE